jgi:hypothetical protein
MLGSLLRFLPAALLADVLATPNRWEAAIRKFQEQDRQRFPLKQGIVFVGSTSIQLWKLGDYFEGLPVTNRGLGGSQVAPIVRMWTLDDYFEHRRVKKRKVGGLQLADCTKFANRIVLPYEPRVSVLYAGDNDIAAGKTPEEVADEFRAFVKVVQDPLPKTRIVFIGIKPSIRRWHLIAPMRQANSLIRTATEQDERLTFVDIDTPMVGDDGRPRRELFLRNGLHLNDKGYSLWASLVRPHIE